MLKDATIQKAIRDAKPKTLSDGAGKGSGRLVLIVKANDTRTTAEFYAQQWKDGKRRMSKIGTYPRTTLQQARDIFDTQYAEVISAKIDIKERSKQGVGTLGELFEAYVADLRRRECANADANEKQLNRIVDAIGRNKPANKVTTVDIVDALRPVYARGSAGMANAFRSYIRAAYSYGIASESDYKTAAGERRFNILINPAAAIPADMPKPGERALSVDELREFWKWLQDPPVKYDFKIKIQPRNLAALKLSCLIGQRATEITRIDVNVYDRESGSLYWPKTKNGLPHLVPLPHQAIKILDELGPNPQGLYFPQLTNERAFVNQHLLKDIVRRYCKRTGAVWFCQRDLRRTWKTLAGSAGISKDDRDRLQNHKKGDVSSRHYDRYEYLKEKRAAMDIWARWFDENIIAAKSP